MLSLFECYCTFEREFNKAGVNFSLPRDIKKIIINQSRLHFIAIDQSQCYAYSIVQIVVVGQDQKSLAEKISKRKRNIFNNSRTGGKVKVPYAETVLSVPSDVHAVIAKYNGPFQSVRCYR